jgi:sulfur carrier protein
MNIQIAVNGAQRTVPSGTTVAALVSDLALGERRVAVEVNGTVVPRSSHEVATLAAGDRVEIVHAIGGG